MWGRGVKSKYGNTLHSSPFEIQLPPGYFEDSDSEI